MGKDPIFCTGTVLLVLVCAEQSGCPGSEYGVSLAPASDLWKLQSDYLHHPVFGAGQFVVFLWLPDRDG